MLTDIEIAREAKMCPISQIAEKLDIPESALETYGRYKSKISLEHIKKLENKPNGKLILVTAISPTPAGEGKTTTTVGLGDALQAIGKKTAICLREPSLGPVFGMKGGATGGGFSQAVPMEDINLHFTGDFGAIQLANNLLAAMIDNHIHHGNELEIDSRRITWKRVVDMNDRALRDIVVGLGGTGNGYTRQDGFDIVVASEVMAILCLANSLKDLKERLGKIVVGYKRDHTPILASHLNTQGAMAVLLKDAFKPNLVQTIENTPAFIHGGPFANIAHGCNSVIATQTALKLADYVVTEAGFGADLGAEKFINIKCRKSGLMPDAAVIVATVRALKFHGGCDVKSLSLENIEAVQKGLVNLQRHVDNVKNKYGLPCVVAINYFATDTTAELNVIQNAMEKKRVPVVVTKNWAEGSLGAQQLAKTVVNIIEDSPKNFRLTYEDSTSLWDKAKTIATEIYGAKDIMAESKVRKEIQRLQDSGYGHYPVCIAKTQYSFSTDPALKGAPEGHILDVREVKLCAGAEFVVFICGDVMTMPGLPKIPSAIKIDLDHNDNIIGLA